MYEEFTPPPLSPLHESATDSMLDRQTSSRSQGQSLFIEQQCLDMTHVSDDESSRLYMYTVCASQGASRPQGGGGGISGHLLDPESVGCKLMSRDFSMISGGGLCPTKKEIFLINCKKRKYS